MVQADALAKMVWEDPLSQETREYVLVEGSTATIGRSSNNDIQIPEHHVSRQHAVVNYRDGVFMISDLGSSNGTFVNDEAVDEPFPLFAGDEIRLYVPIIQFMAAASEDVEQAQQTGRLILPTNPSGQGSLIVTNGPQEGQSFALLLEEVVVGRAMEKAQWDVQIQDPSVSRPHAQLKKSGDDWRIYDLGSSNGTTVNNAVVDGSGYDLHDGDTVTMGGSILLFRAGWESPNDNPPTIPLH